MKLLKFLPLLAWLWMPSVAQAEQMVKLGDWDVHYMALTSSFLTPEVARTYGIQRSKYNALINISVLDAQSKKPQNLVVEGVAKNLLGTTKKLNFKEIIEGEAIYYIAVLPFRDQEQYNFIIELSDGNQQEVLSFRQKFYAD
ncbi:DUF4426 domain-containing protein [Bowmanella dokdonensis]|uniref:DUF4426 domain-containing protein n=1 Tax=Bowmanella dokdonensis TaxID=751969 RepID=A0A939IPN1_9ALTE|nr:DUF4426 domain-containing protein [Bowmanella dokdonensis]MBN7824159.1 DUF4426 domain-containing protein [Bowmanella dokdonensis]